MPHILKLTAIPGLCQGDTYTPDGSGDYPQIINVKEDRDGNSVDLWVVWLDEESTEIETDEDAAAVPTFDNLDETVLWLRVRTGIDWTISAGTLTWNVDEYGYEALTEDQQAAAA